MRKTLLALMVASGIVSTGCETLDKKKQQKQSWKQEGFTKINDSIVRLIQHDPVAEDLNSQSSVTVEEISTRFDKAYYYFNIQDSVCVKGYYLNGPDMYDSDLQVGHDVRYDQMTKSMRKNFDKAVKFANGQNADEKKIDLFQQNQDDLPIVPPCFKTVKPASYTM